MRVSHSVMDREDGDVTGTVCAKDDCHNPRASSPMAAPAACEIDALRRFTFFSYCTNSRIALFQKWR